MRPMKWHQTNGITWGEFPEITALGVTHGMSTRMGGISEKPYDSLNLGLMADRENPDRTLENRRRFFEAVGLTMDRLATYRQIHSDVVEKEEQPGIHAEGADGVITQTPNVVLMALAADCVPVIIVDPVQKALSVVHSGWRGTASGISSKAVTRMINEYESKSKDLWIGIGPSIGECCYEVSREVYEKTWQSVGQKRQAETDHPHLNLWDVIKEQMLLLQVPEKQILIAGHCTCCENDRFFSHRAGDGGRCALVASW